MNGWNDDVRNWPVQCVAQTDFMGRSYLLYLRFRGCWQGFIIADAVQVHDLVRQSAIWSDEMLCGCHIHNLEQARKALISIFKKNLGIKYRVKFTSPRVI